MSEKMGIVERIIKATVEGLSGWVILAIGLVLYPGLGLILPITAGLPKIYLIECNVVGVVLALALGIGWLDVQLMAVERMRLLEWTSNLRLLDSSEFEWLVGEVFRREGWKVKETGSNDGPDGNIDLMLERDGQRTIVQCKRWQSWVVGVEEIRGFAGTLLRENLSAQSGIYVTLSKFGRQARDEAKHIGMQLVDSHDLLTRIDNVRRAENCPRCGSPMVLSHSVQGWWMRCVAKGCLGKRDLGKEPGRALELLLAH